MAGTISIARVSNMTSIKNSTWQRTATVPVAISRPSTSSPGRMKAPGNDSAENERKQLATSTVAGGIAELPICATDLKHMQYKGIRYTIRTGIERNQWIVAIHPGDVEMSGKVITGDRGQAEALAHSMINKWLARHPVALKSD